MIRTWLADVSALAEEKRYLEYYQTVPAFRKEKADRLRFQKDKALSIGAWVLFEKMQKEYGLGEGAFFNLSHSGAYALCSVDDSGGQPVRIGCDLEEIKEERMSVAKHFFCEEEYKAILENKASFYRYWVLKESFMKATGLGMKLGMKEFEIGFSDEDVPILKRKPQDIEGQYHFKEYECGQLPYQIAVCASTDDFDGKLQVIKL